ncbi:dTDP-4-keto-6-deoxy-D-glucose epimerase, partial [Salmonella enterica subsp. enterica serovar Enteritidis]|nr:dTDP-4-keto-6-deoxy-D-glucose epimerase [Salmonella enterica subsp. enterica serovar Enteritidis]
MTLEVVPFSSASSEIDGLKIIHVKMVTDERGTVRELFRQSQHSQVLLNPNMAWK